MSLQDTAQKLLDYAKTNTLVDTQVEDMTFADTQTALDKEFPVRFSGDELNKIKKYVIETLRQEKKETVKAAIISKLNKTEQAWLAENYIMFRPQQVELEVK